jgi:hypothetical protein
MNLNIIDLVMAEDFKVKLFYDYHLSTDIFQ